MATQYQTQLPTRDELLDPRDREPSLINRIVRMGAMVAGVGAALRYGARSGVLEEVGRHVSAALRASRAATVEGAWSVDAWRRAYREGLEPARRQAYEIDRLIMERRALIQRLSHALPEGASLQRATQAIDEAIVERLTRRTGWGRIVGMRQATVDEVGIHRLSAETQEWLMSLPEEVRRGLRADAGLFRSPTGEMIDLGSWDEIGTRTAAWWSRTLPGSILRLRDILQAKRAPIGALLEAGTVHPYFGREPLQETLLFVGGRVINPLTGEVIREGLTLIPGRHSVQSQILGSMAGIGYPSEPHTRLGRFMRWLGFDRSLDIGYQRGSSIFANLGAWFRKFQDPNWGPNLVREGLRRGGNVTEESIEYITQILRYRSRPLSRGAFEALEEFLPDDFRDLSFLSLEEAIESLRRVASRPTASDTIQAFYARVQADPYAFMRSDRASAVRIPFLSHLDIISPEEQIQRAISIEAIGEAVHRAGGIRVVQEAMESAADTGMVLRSEVEHVARLYAAHTWNAYMAGATGEEAIGRATYLLQGHGRTSKFFQEQIEQAARRESPWYEIGPLPEYLTEDELYSMGVEYTVVSASRVGKSFAQVRDLNDFLSAVGQLGMELTAGRHRMRDVTRLTMVPYFALFRLSRGLEAVGLGLSHLSGGSTWDLAKGIFLKRALLGYGLFQGASYADYLMGEISGRSFSQRYWDMMAGARLDIAGWQDALGITEWRKRRYEVTRDVWEPLSGLPFVGWMFDEPQSREELIEYYRTGRIPIRKGRYWSLSNTPFRGGSVSYWLPNEYIMGTTEWKMTDTLYGSEQEYWSRQWFPTPSYPLAPLKFLADPYWLEEKHYHDRPYPMTGSLISPEIPGAPLVNATLGQLIKPQKPMHVDELRALNEQVVAAGQMRLAATGIERRGRIIPMELTAVPGAPELVLWGEEDGSALFGWGVPGGIAVAGASKVSVPLPIGGGVLAGGTRATGDYIEEIGTSFVTGQEVRFDPVDPLAIPEDPLLAPDDPRYHAKQMEYGVRELLGIYGWMAELISGGEPLEGTRVVASANRMASLQRSFWDSELGGLGGEVSEIGRRFLPHPQRTEDWNPIPNQMPDWLPGADYFINFKIGDPYSKIPRGEVRLPGEAYEATHTLYSDPWFGDYGALTRFMILADVAPYSKEYRAYEQTVRAMFREGMLPEEWRPIFERTLEETRKQKRRYDFYEYRFTGARDKVRSDWVTVTRILDSSTFMTEEFPDHPIRLAGVRLNQEMPISNFIQPGMKVQIIYNEDEEARYSSDMLRTIRATVMVRDVNLNYELIRSGIGRETNETHPAAIMARYSLEEIARGEFAEFVAHLNIPIIHRKFLPVNSPLEYYERYRVYGEEWQTWDAPVSTILAPTYRSYAARDPLTASFLGAVTGGIIGQTLLGGGRRTMGGAIAGGLLAGMLSLGRAAGELVTGETYIPASRRKEREIDEYFDVLEFIKYRALYEEAAELAWKKEGVNIDKILNEVQDRQANRTRELRRLRALKRQMIVRGEDPRSEKIREINEQMDRIQQADRLDGIKLGPWAQTALIYRARYESTLFGLNLDNLDYQMIFRALPAADREFFTAFVKETDPKKRRRILELVPENQARIYRRIWGMEPDTYTPIDRIRAFFAGEVSSAGARRYTYDQDRLQALMDYFQEYALPSPDWIGWRADVELDWVKAQVAVEEGVDITNVGLWFDDLEAAQALGIEPIEMRTDQGLSEEIRSRIESLMKGRGFLDVRAIVGPSTTPGLHVQLDIFEDPRERISKAIRAGDWI